MEEDCDTFSICTYKSFEKGAKLWNLCVKPHTKYVLNIDSSWGLDAASFIGMTWKLWKKFETQTFSIMDMFEFQKGAYNFGTPMAGHKKVYNEHLPFIEI